MKFVLVFSTIATGFFFLCVGFAQTHFAEGDHVSRGNRLISVKSKPGEQLFRAEVSFVRRSIITDGRRDEADWKIAPVITPLIQKDGDTDPSSVRVLHDRENLYLYWEIDEPGGINAELTERDGVITSDDYVQVDLRPWLPDEINPRKGYYYTIAVNPAGVVWDSYFDPYLDGFFFSSWDSNAEAAVVRNGETWNLEMTIPFSGLDLFSDPGWNWQLRFHHASRRRPDRVEISSADIGVTVQQDIMVRRPALVSYYWPRPEFMQEVKPDLGSKPESRAESNQLTRLPLVDSRQDNSIWRRIPVLQVDHTDRMGELTAKNPARAQVGLTDKYLCLNLQGDGAKVSRTAGSKGELGEGMAAQMAGVNGVFVDQALFQNECFWIILQPRRIGADRIHQDFYMIIIDNHGGVRGTRYDPYGAPFRSWTPDVQLDLYDTESGWGAEVSINLEALEIPAEFGTSWGLNVFRNRLLESGDSELQAWSYTGNNFLDPRTFGTLEGLKGLSDSLPAAGLERRGEEILSRLEEYGPAYSRQVDELRAELSQIRLSTRAEQSASESRLEILDQQMGVIEASEYYRSVPHPVQGGYPLMDIQFIGENGWAVGAMGTILRTEDGGKTWESVTLETDVDLFRVDFISSSEGWVAGGRLRIAETNESMRHDRRGGLGYIFHTTDGGRTWECQYGERGRLLLGLDFVNGKTGYAAGERGFLLKTEDGGKSWKALNTTGTMNWIYGLEFRDESTGFAVGLAETVIRTDDGGLTWRAVHAPADRKPYGFRPIYNDITFNGETGCIVGQNGTVLISRDGGQTWHPSATYFKTEIRDLMDLRSVRFVTPELGYAVGELGTRMMVTEDGGESWSYRPLPESEWLRAVWAESGGRVVVTGEREKVLLSDDFGRSWKRTRGSFPKADILVMMAHGDDAAINLNAFYAHYAINEGKTIVDLGTLSDVHSSEYEETYNLEHDRNMWMIGVRTATNFNEFETGNNGSDYYHFTERLWGGEENVIRHMVAAIRAYRPEIVITHGGVFGDYDKPGHKLSGRAGLPAFENSGGEVDHFPELTRLGLSPWQAKKLYNLASESYPATLDLKSIGETPLRGTDGTCLEFAEYVIRNFQSQGVYHARNGRLSLVRTLVPVPETEKSVFDGIVVGQTEPSKE